MIISSVFDAFSSISYFFDDSNVTLIPVVFKTLDELFNQSNSYIHHVIFSSAYLFFIYLYFFETILCFF